MALTSNINYPHDYLPMALQEGYALKPISPLLRTDMVTGRARQRRRYTSTPTQTTVSWLMNDVQGMTFEAWFRDALSDGSAWFNMVLRTPIGVKPYLCRFTDIYDGPVLTGGKYWQYSATLELWERPIPDAGWGNFPEFLAGQSIIDMALNREWPKA
ncbi:hypothetical protein CLM71_08795 [Serratia sp. MYb239]|uniref:hypothetical protein n=1 Tax=Serratia sp. MYb239 TaxID=2033438 RepID=UPI000CF675EC|nr:hypothetical protein [Serratia sp. MYb239]AVJ17220.1 hypothetical protein CLM71_08795 [Serratia sp. MYb239]QPT15486.1 hypothetical protein I6G37_11300 [Serratia rubidaea]SQJ21737.1 Uncharacterised protein [Serratia rubidaea]